MVSWWLFSEVCSCPGNQSLITTSSFMYCICEYSKKSENSPLYSSLPDDHENQYYCNLHSIQNNIYNISNQNNEKSAISRISIMSQFDVVCWLIQQMEQQITYNSLFSPPYSLILHTKEQKMDAVLASNIYRNWKRRVWCAKVQPIYV